MSTVAARRNPAERRGAGVRRRGARDHDSDEDLFELAQNVQALAGPLGDDGLVTTARHAENAARAAVNGRDAEAGRSAADCLYSRLDAGTDYVVGEARAVLER